MNAFLEKIQEFFFNILLNIFLYLIFILIEILIEQGHSFVSKSD